MATKRPTPPAKTTGKRRKRRPSTKFELHAPEAREAFLVGDFNDWDPTAFRMRRFRDGTFKKAVQLKPGRYEYLFLVDGQWWTDPANGHRVPNPFGTENSVIEVG